MSTADLSKPHCEPFSPPIPYKGYFFKDLTGQTFGRLLVKYRVAEKTPACRLIRWACQCSCGRWKIISGNKLRNGNTKSCGCLRAEVTKKRMLIHGSSRPGNEHYSVYVIWQKMR